MKDIRAVAEELSLHDTQDETPKPVPAFECALCGSLFDEPGTDTMRTKAQYIKAKGYRDVAFACGMLGQTVPQIIIERFGEASGVLDMLESARAAGELFALGAVSKAKGDEVAVKVVAQK